MPSERRRKFHARLTTQSPILITVITALIPYSLRTENTSTENGLRVHNVLLWLSTLPEFLHYGFFETFSGVLCLLSSLIFCSQCNSHRIKTLHLSQESCLTLFSSLPIRHMKFAVPY
ncbi:uncharacterized protein [Euphorbia lathyris]|uniref:uncharacterized protein isoform X2 n=1 Tax=Euphorbia lathyris TaxID=212925 RepID=UPI003313D2B0